MNLEDLARRVQVLEDIEAIKKLKARYCAYCDNNYDADGLASLFTEDAIWDGGERLGRSVGQEIQPPDAGISSSPVLVRKATGPCG